MEALSDRIVDGNLAARLTTRLISTKDSPKRTGPVLVIAHRGDSLHYPENTLASIRLAFDRGADPVEVDVRLTRDGVPVIFHDEFLDRTTNGTGPMVALTLRQLKMLDAGDWKAPRFRGERVPTLEEALRVAQGRGQLYLDLKVDDLAIPVAQALARVGVDQRDAMLAVTIPGHREEFVRRMPGARLVAVEEMPITWGSDFFWRRRSLGLWGLEFGEDWSASFLGDATTHNMPVFAFTVNDERTMRRLIEIGVSGIETDNPSLLVDILASFSAR